MKVELLRLFWVPIVSGLAIAVICGSLGPFVLLRKLSFLADTIAHACVFGVALGVLLRVGSHWTLLPFAAALGLFLSRFSRREGEESLANLTAVAFTLFLGFGTLLLNLRGIAGEELVHILFGDLIWVRLPDLYWLLGAGTIAIVFLVSSFRKLTLSFASADLARVSGVRVDFLMDLFLVVVSLVIAVCTRIVGVLLASALVVLPPLIAGSFARSFREQLILSPLVGLLGASIGIVLSLSFDLPFGPCISSVLALFFVGVAGWAVTRRRRA